MDSVLIRDPKSATTDQPSTRPETLVRNSGSSAQPHSPEWDQKAPVSPQDIAASYHKQLRKARKREDPEAALWFYDSTSGAEVDALLKEAKDCPGSAELKIGLDCSYDVEMCVEEFSRLTRLGKFIAARDLYDSYPPDLKNLPELYLDLFDTLLKQGAYEFLIDLMESRDLSELKASSKYGIFPNQYVRSISEIARRHVFDFSGSIFESTGIHTILIMLKSNFERLDSTQVQLLCNMFYLDSETERHIQTPKNISKELRTIMSKSLGWQHLYKHLLSAGRIWDMRDLFHALCSRYGVADTIKLFFDPWGPVASEAMLIEKFIERFIEAWTEHSQGDESIDLVILDILVTIALQLISHSSHNDEPVKKAINQAMAYANQSAISLSLYNPENVQTSPYLRWILANQRVAREIPTNIYQIPDYDHLKESQGVLIWTCNLPIYVPLDPANQTDRPLWENQSRRTPENLLKLGLNASRKNGDYALGVQYLEEIFYTSDAPLEIVNELSRLQRDVQGNRMGYLRTCLTKYLCATDTPAMKILSEELRQFDEEYLMSGSTAQTIDPITRWCQRGIQIALSFHLDRKPQTRLYLAKQEEAYEALPYDLKRLLAELGKRDSTHKLYSTEEALPKKFAEPCKGTVYRDGNYIICDSSGYFTKLFTAPDNEDFTD
ncbi:hypothetical protein OCU04_004027 [Sclerotinia nivalis]|uniref:Uncharacterized protein n=1 Tax=Sclerotinia nivalis TaxID=352851 RepID=A0A9X0AWK3_9HELO|nr:hypothetical protein OCU04_004027 [Sclerotinia nivalis]